MHETAGPRPRLDREVVGQVHARMPAAQDLWTRAVQRVLVDLRATTGLRWTCALVAHEDEPDRPALPTGTGAYSSGLQVVMTDLDAEPDADPWSHLPRRPLPLPQLWLECDNGWSTTVDEDEDDPEAACAVAAGRISDEVIDELWRAWPACPGHSHPLEADLVDGRACWACPRDGHVVAVVGALGAGPPGVTAGPLP